MIGLLALRPYQVAGIEAVRATIRTGKRRPVFVLPTGGGKTVCAAAIILGTLELGKRAWFVAHRREIIRQSFAKLIRSGIPPEHVGIIMAGIPCGSADLFDEDPANLTDDELWSRFARRRPNAPIQVASIDTLRIRLACGSIQAPDIIVIDECHRALAKSYRDLAAAYPKAVILGLTATPYRADRRGLGELFDSIVVCATPAQLVELGAIVAPRVWTTSAAAALPDALGGVKMAGTDYDPKALEQAVNKVELVGDIVEHWQRHAGGRRTVVFAAGVEHSRHIVGRFQAAGVPAEHLDGDTPTAHRDAILRRLASGETLVVSNVGCLTEGWDLPAAKCLVLARPTKSLGLALQMAGRVLRPWEGVEPVILDHAGIILEHGFPTDEREFSLAPPKKKKRGVVDAPRGKTCPECLAMVPPSTKVCPGCGYEWPATTEGRELEEKAGELVELDAAKVNAKRLAAWDALVEEWRAENDLRRVPRKPGWCLYEYKKRYGRMPPKDWKMPTIERRDGETETSHVEDWAV